MAVSVPLGVVCFLPLAFLTGELFRLPQFPKAAVAWMAGLGVLHFVIGRYCNFRANSVAGVNLTAPVVQLQVVVTMVLAVVVLHEPCTALQMIGGALILAGSLITQRAPARTAVADDKETGRAAVRAALSRRLPVRLARRHRLRHHAGHGALCAGAHRTVDRHPRRADRLCRGDGRRGAGAVVGAGPAQRLRAQPRQRPLVRLVRRVRRGGAGLLLRGGGGRAGHAGDAAAATVAGVPDAVLDLAQSRTTRSSGRWCSPAS